MQPQATSLRPDRTVPPAAPDTGLFAAFHASVRSFPERPALSIDGEVWSYAQIFDRASRLAAAMNEAPSDPPLAGVLAHRTLAAYTGVLGALAAGRGYVPFNPKFPIERLRRVCTQSGVRVLVVGREGEPLLDELLADAEPMVLLLEAEACGDWAARYPRHRFIGAREWLHRDPAEPAAVAPDAIAYLLFTSGSTGEPKGVPITHANARAYVRRVVERASLIAEDRVSQMSDLTFDWSVQDLFPCWAAGACLCVVPEKEVFAPARFIRRNAITVWASVPSVVLFLQRMRLLKPGSFPTVRYSVFCGEPLTKDQAVAWEGATPNGVIDNFYGPTEVTVAATAYRWDPQRSPAECVNGVVPIGSPFDGLHTRLISESGDEVQPGEAGELCLGGDQVAPGYWKSPRQTAERFVQFDGSPHRWYRTGDVARLADDGNLLFVGRVDHQVKVRGYRVELQEIEHAVRSAVEAEHVVAIAWPMQGGSADGIVAFLYNPRDYSEEQVLSHCRGALPDYMVPRRIVSIDYLPLNANGKVDRGQLVHMLMEERKS
jgi:amino acid adenylation domain-containing protein